MPLHDFWSVELDPDNGAGGKCPVYPSEFKAVGLSSDIRCYVLIEYVYGGVIQRVIDTRRSPPHDHLIGTVIKPGTCSHIGDKLLQMAATNCTGGGHRNTRHAVCHCHVQSMRIRLLARTKWVFMKHRVCTERARVISDVL